MPDLVVTQQSFPVGSLRHSLYYRQDPGQQPSRCAQCVVALDTLRAPLRSQAWTSSVPRGLHHGRLWICRRFWPSPALNHTPSPSHLRFTSCAGVSNAGSHGCKDPGLLGARDLSASSETIQRQHSVPRGRAPGRGAGAGRENSHCDILLPLF